MPSFLRELPIESRPRERLRKFGSRSLADHELLAIILRTGTQKQHVLEVSLEILNHFKNLHQLRNVTYEELLELPGIGPTKAVELLAIIEFGQRLNDAYQVKEGTVASSSWVGNFLIQKMRDLQQEHVVALYLNTKNEIIKKETIFIGSINSSVAHPREIFKGAIRCSAARIIIAHNHPSGNPQPSQTDLDFTKKLAQAGKLIGIELLDHFVIGESRYISLKEEGYL
ncbi:RadC family protein [Allofustis seminis]|uniref:RadC family protein n=1 Tax=Allofustis seminis TaxID=166939 RepID=UPI000373B53B